MSINRGMDKDVAYIHAMEYYSAIKRSKIESFVEMMMTTVAMLGTTGTRKEFA